MGMIAAMNEADIQRAILDYLRARPGVHAWRQQAGRVKVRGAWMSLAPAGAADITGILADGRRLEIEVKDRTGRQSEEQSAWQEMIEGMGGVYVVARSVAEVAEALDLRSFNAG